MANKQSFFYKFIKFFLRIWRMTALVIGSCIMILTILIISAIVNYSQRDKIDVNEVVSVGTEDEIAVVNFDGEIVYSSDDSWLSFNPFVITPDRTKKLFGKLSAEKVKAVIVKINSPGGSVAASEEIYQEMKKLSQSKPVYVYFGEVAASGGYYIALPADKIYASVPTITGSIGVIAYDPDFSGLYDKIGVNIETYKTGTYKDIGSPNRAATDEERQIFNDLIDDSYQLFVDRIVESRDLDRNTVLSLADGKVYSGSRAKASGLIDEVGTYDSVLEAIKADNDLHDATVREYSSSADFENFLGMNLYSILPKTIFSNAAQSRQGLYYLWSY